MNPKVDESNEKFSWGDPNWDAVRTFAIKSLGWQEREENQYIDMVIKTIGERETKAKNEN